LDVNGKLHRELRDFQEEVHQMFILKNRIVVSHNNGKIGLYTFTIPHN